MKKKPLRASYVFTYEGCWACFLVSRLNVHVRFLRWTPGKTEAYDDVEIYSEDRSRVQSALEFLAKYPHISSCRVLSGSPDGKSAVLRIGIRPESCPMYTLFDNFSTDDSPPQRERVDYRGRIHWEVDVKGINRARKIADCLATRFSIEDVQMKLKSKRSPSKKASLLLKEAYERGYFDVPKKISVDELSSELGVPPSTLNIMIRRALRGVVSEATK